MRKLNLILLTGFISVSAFAQHNYGDQSVIYSDNGNVGIGVSQSQEALHIFKRSLANAQAHDVLRIQANTSGNIQAGFGARINFSIGKYGNIAGGTTSTLGAISVYDDSNESSYGTMAFATREKYNIDLANKMWLDRFGNLGIGVSNPSSQLHVYSPNPGNNLLKSISILLTIISVRILIQVSHWNLVETKMEMAINQWQKLVMFKRMVEVGKGTLYFIQETDASTIDEKMRVLSNGNVGIGTTTPDSKLTVVGNIHSREVKVTVNAERICF